MTFTAELEEGADFATSANFGRGGLSYVFHCRPCRRPRFCGSDEGLSRLRVRSARERTSVLSTTAQRTVRLRQASVIAGEVLLASRARIAPWTLCPMTTEPASAREWLGGWTGLSGVDSWVVMNMDQGY